MPERPVIEAEQNTAVPHTEGDAEAWIEMAWRTEMPKAPVKMMTVQMGLEVVMVAVAAMEEPVMAVATVSTVQKPVVTLAAVPALGQKNHPVRVPATGVTESHRCRTKTFFLGPRCCRGREEQARQQQGQHCREEPNNSLLFFFYYKPAKQTGATLWPMRARSSLLHFNQNFSATSLI